MACSWTKEARQKWCTIIGSCLFAKTLGFAWYWSNLYIYTVSYIRSVSEPGSAPVASWVLPLNLSGACLGNVLAGQTLNCRVGKRTALIIGFVAQFTGLASTYFVIDRSVVSFYILLGILSGIGNGFALIQLIQINIEWFRDRAGLLIGLIRSWTVFGAVFMNHFISLYLNPDGELPDIQIGPLKYFTQEDILNRVPFLYLIIGFATLGIQITSFFLIKEKPSDLLITSPKSNNYATYDSLETVSDGGNMNEEKCSNFNPQVMIKSDSVEHYRRIDRLLYNTTTDLTPREMIRTKEFYTLFITLPMANVSYIAINNFYQAFGLLCIRDDFFFTTLQEFYVAVVTIGFLGWGMLVDRITVKTSLIIYFGFLPFLTIFFYFAPCLNQWLFFILALLYAAAGAPLYVIYSAVVPKAFGKTNFSKNYSLVTSLTIGVNLVAPSVMEAVLRLAGWFYVFLLSACLSLASLLLVIFNFKEGL